MPSVRPTFYFDFADPLSYLLELELRAAAERGVVEPARVGFELRPPPTPLILQDDPELADRWAEAHRIGEESGIELAPPRLVPWTRKAHELLLLAAENDAAEDLRLSLFEAYLLHGRDIGRVDVLVDLAGLAGLGHTETKAVLDVDRHEAAVATARAAAEDLGITGPPVLVHGDRRLEGFHNRTTLGTFLGSEPDGRHG